MHELQVTLAPPEKVHLFSTLNYRVIYDQNINLPLGDSVVLFSIESERKFKAFLEKTDALKAVFLPLSPNHVLIGDLINDNYDLHTLSGVIADCSLEYFISCKKCDANENLRKRIGTNSHRISQAEIKEIIDDIISPRT